MKTPEDEAFEDIERRQGGGFKAKQAMAADKFIAAEERKVGERYGYVPKLHPSEWMDESAQEPVARVLQIIKELRPAIKPMEGMGKGKTTAEWFDILVKEIERIQPAQEGECPNLKNCKGQCFQCEYIDAETGETCYPIAQPAQEQEEDWGALAEKQLASIKRDTQASFGDAMVRATHKVIAEFEAQPAQELVAWVGLTDEERESIAQDYSLTGFGYQSPFKAIEDKLKEKNT
jgi:hypothetical protein